MIEVRRAADRFHVAHDGIETWHSFSAGAHYDPANVSFGPLIACDEHLLAPGAGFPFHSHARVELVSWVLAGSLQHRDRTGRCGVVEPGRVQYQRAGRGIEHEERNASDSQPLRFVQLWLRNDADEPTYDVRTVPVHLESAEFAVVRQAVVDVPMAHVFATATCRVAGHDLRPGDTLRAVDERLDIDGDGDVLVITVKA